MHRIDKVGDNERELARGLTGLLADSYVLYNTTQSYHWNVVGDRFITLHELFERQYSDLAEAVDEIAERIRTLGFAAVGTLAEILENTRLRQRTSVNGTDEMLKHLLEGHRQVAHRCREVHPIAEKAMDEATLDLLVERLRFHEKCAWMLASEVGQAPRIRVDDRDLKPAS